MSLTRGNGPLATHPAEFNFDVVAPKHRIFFHDYPRRVRALDRRPRRARHRGGKFLHESNILPVFYFPIADLDRELLADSDHTTHCPFKGDATYWHVKVGDRTVENAIWRYEQPIALAPLARRPRRALRAPRRHLADRGRPRLRALPRPLPPRRRPQQLARRHGPRRRRDDRNVESPEAPVRDRPAAARLPPAEPTSLPGVLEPSPNADGLPLQGPGHLLARSHRGRPRRGRRLELRGAARRGRAESPAHVCFDLGDVEVDVS